MVSAVRSSFWVFFISKLTNLSVLAGCNLTRCLLHFNKQNTKHLTFSVCYLCIIKTLSQTCCGRLLTICTNHFPILSSPLAHWGWIKQPFCSFLAVLHRSFGSCVSSIVDSESVQRVKMNSSCSTRWNQFVFAQRKTDSVHTMNVLGGLIYWLLEL